MTSRAAFSLIEMLVTIAVLSILVTVGVWTMSPTEQLRRAQDSKIDVEINQLEARVRDWQIAGGQLEGLSNVWQPICRYKEVPDFFEEPCVYFDAVQDDGYIDVIPWTTDSVSPYTGYEARSESGIVQVQKVPPPPST